MIMTVTTTTLAIVAIAAALSALAPLLVNGAYAAISSTNTGCTNNGYEYPIIYIL
jgi:hypothetical protein